VVDVSDRLSQGSDIITLLNITDGSVIDNVTYGAGNAPDPTATQSAGRYPNGNDTDDGAATANNSNDFRIFDNPTPEAINGILDVPASATVGDKIWINGTGFEATVILSSNQTVTTDATGWYNMTNLPVPTNLTDEQLGDGNMTFSSDVNITEIVFETGGDSLSITADLPSKTKVIEAPLSKFEGVIDTNVSYNLSMKLKSQGDLTVKINQTINAGEDGVFNVSVNTTGMPDGSYLISADGVEKTMVFIPTGLPKTGNIDGVNGVDFDDVIYLAKYYYDFTGYETIYADGNVDSVNGVDFDDVIYLAKYYYDFTGYEQLYP